MAVVKSREDLFDEIGSVCFREVFVGRIDHVFEEGGRSAQFFDHVEVITRLD